MGQKHLKLQLAVAVIYCTLSNNIYLSAQSAVPKDRWGWEQLWGVDHLTSTGALFSINEFDVGSVAGNDWLVGDLIGLIWHCSRLDSESWTEGTAMQDEEWIMCALVSQRKEHNLENTTSVKDTLWVLVFGFDALFYFI